MNAVGHASLEGPSSPEPSMLAATSVSPQVLLCQARSHWALDAIHLQMHIHVKKCILLVRKEFDEVDLAAEIGNVQIMEQMAQSLKFAGPLCVQCISWPCPPWGGCCSQPPARVHPQKLHPCRALLLPWATLGSLPELSCHREAGTGACTNVCCSASGNQLINH